MSAKIIDGKAIAESLREDLRQKVADMSKKPGLAVILVGDNPASEVYVRNKIRACEKVGIISFERRLPASVSQQDLLKEIELLNSDKEVHGILLQLPLPDHLDPTICIETINPEKDVDGLHPENIGLLVKDQPRVASCTPAGVIEMLKYYDIPIAGKKAVVIGRSQIVGKPHVASSTG